MHTQNALNVPVSSPAKVQKGACNRGSLLGRASGLRLPASLAVHRWAHANSTARVALCAQSGLRLVVSLSRWGVSPGNHSDAYGPATGHGLQVGCRGPRCGAPCTERLAGVRDSPLHGVRGDRGDVGASNRRPSRCQPYRSCSSNAGLGRRCSRAQERRLTDVARQPTGVDAGRDLGHGAARHSALPQARRSLRP